MINLVLTNQQLVSYLDCILERERLDMVLKRSEETYRY